MSKSLSPSDAIYRDLHANRPGGGLAQIQQRDDGRDARAALRRGPKEKHMSKARRILRRVAIGLLALLIVAAAAIAGLWWSLTPSDVAAADPVTPLGPVSPVDG